MSSRTNAVEGANLGEGRTNKFGKPQPFTSTACFYAMLFTDEQPRVT